MKLILALFIVSFSFASFAVSKGGRITRGGFGFLFPDHNSFSNPGQFAVEKGLAFEGTLEIASGTATQTAVPSMVFGNGTFGLGLFASRTGESVMAGSTSMDTMGGGFGIALAKERLTIGMGLSKPLEDGATSGGFAQGTLTLNGAKRAGFTMGVGFSSPLAAIGTDVTNGKAAMGYATGSGFSIEAVGEFNNFNDFSDTDLSGFVNFQTTGLYVSGGYTYAMVGGTSLFKGRLGFVLAGFDISGFASYPLEASDNLSFGGSFRMAI